MRATLERRISRRTHARTEAERARANALALMPELTPVPRRRLYHRGLQVLVGLVSLTLILAIFGGTWAYQDWQREVGPQVETETDRLLSQAEVGEYRAAAAAAAGAPAGAGAEPIVLTYHDIGPNEQDSPYIVSAERFAAQMAMLHEAGYRTITAAQFTDYVRGTYTPPPRSVLITFDDGTGGLYRYADPILAEYDFTAVSFIITGRVGLHRPYYLTWRQVEWMHDSGRWDFQSHTHDLHTEVPIAPGAVGSDLSNRVYADGRTESMAAFRARVTEDLERSVRDFADQRLPQPTLFAWPFSDVGAEELSDTAAVDYVQGEVARLFDISFIDKRLDATPVTEANVAAQVAQRFEVLRDDTTDSVFRAVERMATLPVTDLRPLDVERTWLEPGGFPAPLDLHDDVVQADASTLTSVTANWAVQRTSTWTDYAVEAVVDGLATGGDTAGLRVRVEHAGEIAVRLSGNSARIEGADEVLVEAPLGPGPHALRVEVTPEQTAAYVDGRLLGTVAAPEDRFAAQGGFGLVVSRASTDTAFPVLRDLRVQPL
ncbi:polysaccharide deacetylase family protein [Geodermatophilus sp. SYSU D00703]